MNSILQVNNVSKKYLLGAAGTAYETLRESIAGAMRAPWKRLRRNGNSKLDTLWALKDVSFEVEAGEVVGIIGRNGAGKSTILKILSRITEPTTGRIDLYGRVASLLEVGTGFHPELTGRENIYLNGAILGMRKAEIARKFDEIVAFSELEQFLDTPVKRYSSGMYMRLAFAVASHLEPEILIVDEVLAVGDAAFQQKCIGKMGEVAKQGRTVLFVSHNMVAVQSLCSRVVWLDQGQIIESGETVNVIGNYLKKSMNVGAASEEIWHEFDTAPGTEVFRIHRIRVRPQNGSLSEPLTMTTPFVIEIEYWNLIPNAKLHVTLHLYTEQQIIAFTTGSTSDTRWKNQALPAGFFRSTCHVPGGLLNAGRHRFEVLIIKDSSSLLFKYDSTVSFEILDFQERNAGWYGREPGIVHPELEWTTEHVSADGAPATFSRDSGDDQW